MITAQNIFSLVNYVASNLKSSACDKIFINNITFRLGFYGKWVFFDFSIVFTEIFYVYLFPFCGKKRI